MISEKTIDILEAADDIQLRDPARLKKLLRISKKGEIVTAAVMGAVFVACLVFIFWFFFVSGLAGSFSPSRRLSLELFFGGIAVMFGGFSYAMLREVISSPLYKYGKNPAACEFAEGTLDEVFMYVKRSVILKGRFKPSSDRPGIVLECLDSELWRFHPQAEMEKGEEGRVMPWPLGVKVIYDRAKPHFAAVAGISPEATARIRELLSESCK